MIEARVYKFIREHTMLFPGDVCLVGLSGGADSVCLLVLLNRLKTKLGIQIQAVHVNHNIRGEEAIRDARYAKDVCRSLDIPFYEYSYPVQELAREKHMGTEEMGRLVRKKAYTDCMNRHGATKLALAHHQNDLTETFLFHLARGTSLNGLAAIRPVRDNVIRPLLCVSRKEIEDYLNKNKIRYCEDSTNAEDDYTRNRIRHHVLSYLTEHVNKETVSHISAVSFDILEVLDYIERQAKRVSDQSIEFVCSPDAFDSHKIIKVKIKESFFQYDHVLQRTAVMRAIQTLCGESRNITREHVEGVLKLWQEPVGKQIDLPYKITAVRNYHDIELTMKWIKNDIRAGEIYRLPLDQEIQWGSFRMKAKVFPYNGQLIPEKTCTKWFDYGKINPDVVFRTRKSGDYIMINASGGHKKLKDYLIDCKIPRHERDQLLLLTSGSEVLWVVGYRIGESAKVDENTKQILEIQVTGGNTNE